jgi:hypothetical protein
MKIATSQIMRIVTVALAAFSATAALAQDGSGLELIGADWQVSGDQIEINATEVVNNNEYDSGSLELVVWATTSPYEGGSLTGYAIGTCPLDPLPGEYHYSDVGDDETYYSPPDGSYYTTVALEEYDGAQYVIVDYENMAGTYTVGSPSTDYYTIVTESSPPSGGTVTGGGTYAAGATVSLRATAAAGYYFAYWTYAGKEWSAAADVSTTAEGDYTFAAVFEPAISTDQVLFITNGLGKITRKFTGQELIVGQSYSVTAVAGTGQLFSNWSGSISSTNSTLTFLLESNMTLQANFVPNPFTALKGVYNGLFYRTVSRGIPGPPPSNIIRLVVVSVPDHESSGFVTFTLAQNGAYSGKIMTAGQSYPIKGQFWVDGSAQLTIPAALPEPLRVNLQLDLTGGTQQVNGSVSNVNWAAAFSGNRAPFNGSALKSPQAGRYTLAFAPSAAEPGQPQGTSFGVAVVSESGTVQFSGTLADGTAVSQSVGLSESGAWPLYVSLYGGQGSLLSWVTLTNEAGGIVDETAAATPACWWIKAGPAGNSYTGGFTNSLNLAGSPYKATSGTPLLNLSGGEGQVVLSAANLSESLTHNIVLNPRNQFIVTPTGDKLQLSVAASSGLMQGSFVDPSTGLSTAIKGVLLQQQTSAAGFFLSAGQSGAVSLMGE